MIKSTALLLLLVLFKAALAQNTFTFQNVNSPVGVTINEIKFLDTLRGIAVSNDKILSTIDGGNNWTTKFTVPNFTNISNINILGNGVYCDGYDNIGPSRITFNFNSSTYTVTSLPLNSSRVLLSDPILLNGSVWARNYAGIITTTFFTNVFQVIYPDPSASFNIYNGIVSIWKDSTLLIKESNVTNWDTLKTPTNICASHQRQSYYDGDSTIYLINQCQTENFISTDYGQNWSRLGPFFNLNAPPVFYFVDSTLILGIDAGRLKYSTDHGYHFDDTTFASNSFSPGHITMHSTNKWFLFSPYSDSIFVATKDLLTATREKEEKENQITVFPNPTSGELFIKLQSFSDKVRQLELIDMKGNTVLSFSSFREKISLNGLEKGIYLLKLKMNEKVITQKIQLVR